MLTKSQRAIAASVLALAAAGGGSFAVIRAVSPAPALVAPAALPSPAGSAATATVPRGAGGADGAESGSVGAARQQGTPAAADGSGAGGGGIPALPRSAGQGNPGPLPSGTIPADGAVPGASPAIQALAAARAATTALPHSPELLAATAGTGTGDPAAATSSPVPSSAASPTASPAASPTLSSPGSPVATGSAAAAGSPAPTGSAGSPAPTGSPAPAGSAASPAGPPSAGGPTAAAPQGAASAAQASRTVAGLDVAGFQHPVSKQFPGGEAISWTAVAAAGYRYAAVKATEGDYYVNPWAATDLAKAKAAGLDVAPYHFAVPNVSGGAAQAQFAVEYSGYAPGARMLPLMLDIEYDPYVQADHSNECYGLTPAQMTAWLGAFVSAARSLTGQYPVIYTTADWWDTCTGRSAALGADPMWVAAYGFARPPVPAGWHAWTFWQYTSGGTVPGVAAPGTTDLDSFSPAAVGLIDPGSQSSLAGARVSLPVGSLGAAAGEALKYAAAGLPPGLSVTAGGTITGTVTAAPAKAATYRVTLSVTNGTGAEATAAFSWQVNPAR